MAHHNHTVEDLILQRLDRIEAKQDKMLESITAIKVKAAGIGAVMGLIVPLVLKLVFKV